MILILSQIPCLLNQLYTPLVKSGRPCIIKSKKGRESIKYIQMECLRQKLKPLVGDIKLKIDFCIQKRDKDADSPLKTLLDGLNKYAYDDDNQIVDLHIRKHRKQEKDELIISIEQIEDEQKKIHQDELILMEQIKSLKEENDSLRETIKQIKKEI